MTTRTYPETSDIKSGGSAATKLRCFIPAAVLVLCAVYLLGGAVLRLLTQFPPLYFSNGWTFTGTIIFAVITGVMAFSCWLVTYGELIRTRMICATGQHDLSKVACPECGKTSENSVSGMSDRTVPQDSSQQGSLDVSKLRGIRFMGGILLAIAALFLFLVGIFDHIPVSLMQGFAETPAALFKVFAWEALFQNGVAVAVLLAVVGFFIWFIPYRRLARAAWLCPSCHYDLSGIPCPKCDVTGSVEPTT
jgi:hypothetical protein